MSHKRKAEVQLNRGPTSRNRTTSMPTSPPEAVPGDALTILDLGSEPDDKITVLRSQLLRYFEYFKQYSDLQWPASFVIKSPNAEAATWCVVPASAGLRDPASTKSAAAARAQKHATTVNKLIFKIFTSANVDDILSVVGGGAKPLVLCHAARLAQAYGNLRCIRGHLTVELYAYLALTNDGMSKDSYSIMELELSLTNASLLKKAYKHCVGQAYRDSIDHNVVGAGIIPLVSSGVKKLEGLVLDVVQALRSLSAAQGHKQTLAAVIADQIYQRNISTKIWARIHRDKFFDSLSWLDGIRIPLELIDNTDSGWILDEAQVQEDGVTGAGEVFAKQGVDSESNDPDYIKWSTAAKHDLGKDRICEELQWLSKRTKSILEQLLLAEDRGYFTCVEWEGPLPWENHA